MSTTYVENAAQLLEELRRKRPLVHNITNYVVMDVSANALLSIGASPVMAHAAEEVREMVALAGALVLNIGTLSRHWIDAMFSAGQEARARRIPIILDPVGAGATRLRTETALRLVEEVRPTVIRGNASEILSLAQSGGATKGVDSTRGVGEARETAIDLAKRFGAIVAVTGAEDFIANGERSARVANGHALMGRVTGTGCVASALIGAFSAVQSGAMLASAAALAVFGIAGEMAADGDPSPGTYRVRLIDALDQIRPEHVRKRARIAAE
jgi:hydroxyethylthiazole kinase